MIKEFVYELDEKGKMTIVGLVEDNKIEEYNPDNVFKLIDKKQLNLSEDERLVLNEGRQGYMTLIGDFENEYVDVNVYGGAVRIKKTSNLEHAALYSEEMFESILDYANYFDYEDTAFKFSGMTYKKGRIDDLFNHFFKDAIDASYIKINKSGSAYFVAKEADNRFYITTDFSKAFKVPKKLIRKVLTINEFIDEHTRRSDLSFSIFKALATNEGYIYSGLNPSYITLKNNILNIKLNPSIPLESRLVKDENIFNILKDISYLISKEKTDKSFCLEINNKYVKKLGEFSYEIVSNPAYASLISDYEIEIIKQAYRLFDSNAMILRKNRSYFLYTDGCKYILSANTFEKLNGRMIDQKIYNEFVSTFSASFNNNDKEDGVILLTDQGYVKVVVENNASFTLNYINNAYDASVFSKNESEVLKKLIGVKFNERSLENLLRDLEEYQIYYNDKIEIDKCYESIMEEILEKKTTVVPYSGVSNLRCETEKGALEYARRFYLKDILDYKDMFDKTLNANVKNILIISPKLNLEVEALAMSAKDKVNVYILNESKFGYLPVTYITKNINIAGTYRLKLANLTKNFVSKFDMIVFGKNFKEEVSDFKNNLDKILESDKNIIFLNNITANFEKNTKDSFYGYFKNKLDLKRKYHVYDFPYKTLVDSYNEKFARYLYQIGNMNTYPEASYDKVNSYHSIVIKQGHNLIDFYNNNSK